MGLSTANSGATTRFAGVEKREAAPVGSEGVTMLVIEAARDAVQPQTAEVVAHLVGAVAAAEQRRDVGTEPPVRESGHGMQ